MDRSRRAGLRPDKAPSYRPEPGTGGPAGLAGDDPFVMQADGKGWLFAPKGMLDGPLPTHYEPQESPVRNPLYPQQSNPARMVFPRKDNLWSPSGDAPGADVYPYVFTTYRLTEHHTAGGMSRWLPYLSELQPEFFCEVSPELAAERGLENGGWATIVSARAAIEARVLVTERMTPLTITGRTIHQVGLPYHWGVGSDAVVSGDAANDLLGVALDPNVQIQECKAGSCDIVPGRRPAGEELLRLVAEYQSRSGTHRHDEQRAAHRPPGVHARHERRLTDGLLAQPALRADRPGGRRRVGHGTSHARASSPTPRSASAARRARWPARSGTASPRTASTC